jgi:hemerythrin-like metal-binding domain
MSVIKWTPANSVGIASIDDQHKKLFEHLNNFYSGLTSNQGKENLSILLNALTDYTVYHFSAEEKLMKQYEYPGFLSHKAEHDKFIATISSYNERLKAGKLIVSIEITNYLKDWIVNHILILDKKYSSYLQGKGVR